MTVREVSDRADVGRSTFYEHFEGKDDLLRQSVTPLLDVLAGATGAGAQAARIEGVLTHFWDNRRLARIMLGGPARRLMPRSLADLIEDRLTPAARGARGGKPLVPLRLIAAQLGEGQLALVESWLAGSPPCTAAAVARALIAGTRASAFALVPEVSRPG